MKRKICTLIVGLILSLTGIAQDGVEGGVYANYFQLGYRGQSSFGGQLHLPFGGIFTANYRVSIGPSNKGLYLHAPAGMVAGAYLLSQAGSSDFLSTLGILLFVVPEGVGVYIKDEGKIRPHLSVNPLGFEYWHRKTPFDENAKMSGNICLRLKIESGVDWFDFVAPEVGGTWIYTPGQTTARYGFHAGLTIGYGE
jgi:hypothetical protein